MTAIILLNWNGCDDTLACLESLSAVKGDDFYVVVADNGSTDDSVNRLIDWGGKQTFYSFCKVAEREEQEMSPPSAGACILYTLSQNYGFAKGNNLAIELVSRFHPDHYLVLNNDTEVEPDFLQQLALFQTQYPQYEVLSPLISLYSPKGFIWNCGGRLFAGFRKYYYAGKPVSAVKESSHIPVSFITGCALYFSPRVLDEQGQLFTERFFFGEEDFAFSLRMQREGVGMACVVASRIYHKVGRSTSKLKRNDKRFVYFLNRYIDVRLHYSSLFFNLWSGVYSLYIVLLLLKAGTSVKETCNFIRRLHADSRRYDGVTREMYMELMGIKR